MLCLAPACFLQFKPHAAETVHLQHGLMLMGGHGQSLWLYNTTLPTTRNSSSYRCCVPVSAGSSTILPCPGFSVSFDTSHLLYCVCWSCRVQGLLPNLIKLAPAAGISWYVFEETKILLGVDPRS